MKQLEDLRTHYRALYENTGDIKYTLNDIRNAVAGLKRQLGELQRYCDAVISETDDTGTSSVADYVASQLDYLADGIADLEKYQGSLLAFYFGIEDAECGIFRYISEMQPPAD